MNALKLPELVKRGHSFKQRVAAAARATARIVPFVRSSAMATMTQTLSPEARDHQRPTMLERVASAAKVLPLPGPHRDKASVAPTTMFGGGDGGAADADAELLQLGHEFDAAVAMADRFNRDVEKPANRVLNRKVGPRPNEESPDYPEWSARWKAAYEADLKPIEKAGEDLEETVTELAECIAEYEPETPEGLEVSIRALRRVAPELWGDGPSDWTDLLAGTVLDAAVRLVSLRQAERDVNRSMEAVTLPPNVDADIEAAFAGWADQINAVRETDANPNYDCFMAAYSAESDTRKAIWTAEAHTLRGLQMRAMAYVSDGAGMLGGADEAAKRANGWKQAMEHEPLAAAPTHAFVAYSLARDLIRLAEAEPNGPSYPSIVPLKSARAEH